MEITWLHRGSGAPGSFLLPTLTRAELPAVDYAWVCGESSLVTGVRRHLVKERGIDRRKVMFSGYWKLGQTRG